MKSTEREQLREAMRLYAVTDRRWLAGADFVQTVRESLAGGVTFLQLREKDLDEQHFYTEAVAIKALCQEYGVPFVVNDDVDVALRVGADGVHVGQHDMEAGAVRELLGPEKILGVSAQTVAQAVRAQEMGADYLGVGAVFPTGSKDDADAVTLPELAAICQAVTIPVVAIGGITRENLPQLAGTGIAGIAVISAIYAQPDVHAAAADLRAQLDTLALQ